MALFFAVPTFSTTTATAPYRPDEPNEGNKVIITLVPRLLATPRALIFVTIGTSGAAPEVLWHVEVKSGTTWKYLGRTAGSFTLAPDFGTGRGPALDGPFDGYGDAVKFKPGDVVPIMFDTRGLLPGATYRFWTRAGVQFTATFPLQKHSIDLEPTIPPAICQRKSDYLPTGRTFAARIDLDRPATWARVDGTRCSEFRQGTYQVHDSTGLTRYFTTSLMK
jgi:hypothetical protein